MTSVLLTYNPHFGAFHKSRTDECQKRWYEDSFARFVMPVCACVCMHVCVCVGQRHEAHAQPRCKASKPLSIPRAGKLGYGCICEQIRTRAHIHPHVPRSLAPHTRRLPRRFSVVQESCCVSGQGHCKQSP